MKTFPTEPTVIQNNIMSEFFFFCLVYVKTFFSYLHPLSVLRVENFRELLKNVTVVIWPANFMQNADKLWI